MLIVGSSLRGVADIPKAVSALGSASCSTRESNLEPQCTSKRAYGAEPSPTAIAGIGPYATFGETCKEQTASPLLKVVPSHGVWDRAHP